eukprot:TRINITY_DN3632_c0_g2_i1.p1 TRINITY_DN3632_c0_g2~~TRINITY_DN3632_c0_g2_i1.p1  ORF type:complete len:497 (+),score=100.90 TRINITY_DN3632_c0_g2_i1:61-1491(+)
MKIRRNVRVLTLNRPKVLNALSLDQVRWLTPRYKIWSTSDEVPINVLRGSGSQAFCAGGDIVSLVEANEPGRDRSIQDKFFREEYQLNYLIGSFQRPHIAFIDGFTMGGGVGLSVHGQFRVATENTMFAMPETGIGFFPDVGGSFFLPRLPGELGMFLGLTGYRLNGYDAYYARIATHFMKADRFEAMLENLGRLQRVNWDTVNETLLELCDPVPQEKLTLRDHRQMIDRCFRGQSIEEIMELLKEEKSDFATKQLKTLEKMCPISLKVTHEQLRRGKMLSLGDCLKMEFRISQRFMQGNDFNEGVRAMLIDKPRRAAKWSTPLPAVTDDMVSHFFEPLEIHQELRLVEANGERVRSELPNALAYDENGQALEDGSDESSSDEDGPEEVGSEEVEDDDDDEDDEGSDEEGSDEEGSDDEGEEVEEEEEEEEQQVRRAPVFNFPSRTSPATSAAASAKQQPTKFQPFVWKPQNVLKK